MKGLFTSRFPDPERLSPASGRVGDLGDRGAVTTVAFPLAHQPTEPVRLNTNLLLREPFAVVMDDMEDHYMLYVYQPNMRKKDVSMTLLGDVLTIHGSRRLRGVSYELSRELALPSDADVSQLQAEYTSGRIDVKIPKISSRRVYRSIPIQDTQPTPTDTSTSMDTDTKQAPPLQPTLSPRRHIPIAGVTTQESEEQPTTTPQEQAKETTPTSRNAGAILKVSDETSAPAPAPAPSPRRNIPIGGIRTETTPQAKPTPTSMESDSRKMMPPPSPRSRTHPTPPTTPETYMASQQQSKPSMSCDMETKHSTKATSVEAQQQSKAPTSTHTQATRECEPFPCVDVGGIPEPADTGAPNNAPSTTTESSLALESDVSMTGHDISIAKQHAQEEKQSHELERDIQQHHVHTHHPQKVAEQKHDQPSQVTESKAQEKVTERKQEEGTQLKQPSIISSAVDVAKKATQVVTGTGSK